MLPFTAWATRERTVKLILRVPHLLLLGLAIALSACSGGGPATTGLPDAQTASAATYKGPAPGSADVQAFKVNLWQYIDTPDRCGNCHKAGGQTPQFARADDVNLAYSAALTVVNLAQPDQSLMVLKVGGGHNCWLVEPAGLRGHPHHLDQELGGRRRRRRHADQTAGPGHQERRQHQDLSGECIGQRQLPPSPRPSIRCSVSSARAATMPTPPPRRRRISPAATSNEAYANAQAKINLDTPTLSRFYVRLHDESHNCWVTPGDSAVSCPKSAAAMLAAIQAFVGGIAPTQVDPTLVLSKALTLYDGTIASGNNRYDSGVIAKWQFKEGAGSTADDTSGVDPALNLTLSGDTSWVGGWGVSFGPNGGAARGGAASRKIFDLIKAGGEYSVEMWVAPANVTQEDAYMASYSGGTASRNFTLGQHAYQYEMFARSSATDANGGPSLLTADTDKDAQASLQHVVLTYDPVNGRRLYVNGNYTGRRGPASRAARSATGTTPSSSCSATRPRATASGKEPSALPPSSTTL